MVCVGCTVASQLLSNPAISSSGARSNSSAIAGSWRIAVGRVAGYHGRFWIPSSLNIGIQVIQPAISSTLVLRHGITNQCHQIVSRLAVTRTHIGTDLLDHNGFSVNAISRKLLHQVISNLIWGGYIHHYLPIPGRLKLVLHNHIVYIVADAAQRVHNGWVGCYRAVL